MRPLGAEAALLTWQEAVAGADVLIFCTPHQFTRSICMQLRGKIDPNAIAISLTKARWVAPDPSSCAAEAALQSGRACS
jgi:predicted dinucleotide-binding enzyme